MGKITNPHDKYFRASMSDLRVAKSFLKAHLPKKILEAINWDSLRLVSSHHIDKDLSETMSDILYRIKLGNEEGYISILVEHQSSVDRLMPFRVFHYCLNIMKDYLKAHPGRDLPVVVPIVFYSGQSPYYGTTDIFNLFGKLELLARDIFLRPFQLVDVGRIPDEQLRQHAWASVMELAQKHIWEKNFLSLIKALAPLLNAIAGQDAEDYTYTTIKYLYNAADVEDVSTLTKVIHDEMSSKVGERAMSIADKLHEKGRMDGWQEGELATKQSMAKRMLEEGADIEFVAKVTGYAAEELEVLA